MDFVLIFKALLSLVFVIGAIFLVFGLMKWCEAKGLKNPVLQKIAGQSRLSIIETKRVGAKNTLLLLRCDDEEYLLLLGNTQNLVLKTKKVAKND